MRLPDVDHVACQKAEHSETTFSPPWQVGCSKQPVSVGQITLALVKLHFIPATPPLVGPTAKSLSGGLASKSLGSPWAAGPGHSACPGTLVLQGHKQCRSQQGKSTQPTTTLC